MNGGVLRPQKKAADALDATTGETRIPGANVRNDSADKLNEVKKDIAEIKTTNTSRRKNVLGVWAVRHNNKSSLRQ